MLSDEEDSDAAVETRGPLRGLNLNNVLWDPQTQASVEISDDENGDEKAPNVTQQPVHSTRASRYGRAAVNYDMKYHPMDEVTRPKRAAKRRSGSRSVSTSAKRDLQDDTSEESEASEAKDARSEPESETDGQFDIGDLLATQRVPDPKATRRSGRSEAHKAVNYSRKYHPQDYGVPGYQHKAKQLPSAGITPSSKISNKRKLVEDSADEEGSDLVDEEDESTKSPVRARKQLKSTMSNSPTTLRAKEKLKNRKGKQRRNLLSDMNTEQVTEVLDELIGSVETSDGPNMPTPTQEHDYVDGADDKEAAFASSPPKRMGTKDSCTQTDGHAAVPTHVSQAHELLTPPSDVRLVVVRPYATGYAPTILDPRELQLCLPTTDSAIRLHPFGSTSIDHSYSSSSDAVDASNARAEETRLQVLRSHKARSTDTPCGTPRKSRLEACEHVSSGEPNSSETKVRHGDTNGKRVQRRKTVDDVHAGDRVPRIDHTYSSSSGTAPLSDALDAKTSTSHTSAAHDITTPANSPLVQIQHEKGARILPTSSTLVGASGTATQISTASHGATQQPITSGDLFDEGRSDFEAHFAVTDGVRTYQQAQVDSSFGKLPVSQRERSDDQEFVSLSELCTRLYNAGEPDSTTPTASESTHKSSRMTGRGMNEVELHDSSSKHEPTTTAPSQASVATPAHGNDFRFRKYHHEATAELDASLRSSVQTQGTVRLPSRRMSTSMAHHQRIRQLMPSRLRWEPCGIRPDHRVAWRKAA